MHVLWCRRCTMIIQTLSWSLRLCCDHRLYDCIAAILIFAGLQIVQCGQHLRWVETLQNNYALKVHHWKHTGSRTFSRADLT